MTAANLGTKRQCPKCAAKFYDFGAVSPIKCPKCAHSWKVAAENRSKTVKAKKEPVVKKAKVAVAALGLEEDVFAADLPEVDDDVEDLEPMEDEEVEMTSLEEVEEHEEEEVDPNSDDAEDEMFTGMVGEEKLVDDLEQYIETDEDHDDENEEE